MGSSSWIFLASSSRWADFADDCAWLHTLVDRIVTRDMRKVKPGSVIYTPWCDERGKVIDDGTVSRLSENVYRWTAADPSLRWFQQNALGLDVRIESPGVEKVIGSGD